jgi:hypothetical protein
LEYVNVRRITSERSTLDEQLKSMLGWDVHEATAPYHNGERRQQSGRPGMHGFRNMEFYADDGIGDSLSEKGLQRFAQVKYATKRAA